jgi:maltooligosyltrehalose trehalohydrolase
MLAWYRDLLALRRAEADLSDPRLDRVDVSYDATARWVVVTRGGLRVVCNLSTGHQPVPVDQPVGRLLLASDPQATITHAAVELPAESVAVVRVSDRAHLE